MRPPRPFLKIIAASVTLTAVLWPLASLAQDFNPSMLIEDERFADPKTLGGAEGIQKFLESRGSVLADLSPEFLARLREPGDPVLKSRLPDPRPNLGRLRTAAELIHDAASSAGLNPQVILVTLHKEQSLISGKFSSEAALQRALDRALGFACPDEGRCSDIFLGFYFQLFGNFDADGNRYIGMPASLMRSFYFEVNGARVGRGPSVNDLGQAYGNGSRSRVSRIGDTIILQNTQGPPFNAPATQSVVLSNFATAALYRYTPHVYNGNFNFWRFFSEWFRYPNGTLIQTAGDPKIYVIDNGLRRPISSFVISQLGLDPAKIVNVSPLEFGGFPPGDVMPPKDGALIRSPSNQVFLMEAGTRKLLSSFVAQQRMLDLTNAALLPEEEVLSYEDGGRALPAEGTLVKSRDNPAVFLITNQQKRLLSAFVFNQRGFRFADVLTAEPGELETYPAGSIMPPLDGTLIKAEAVPAVYHVGNGQLEPLTLFVFQIRGFRFADVKTVSPAELQSWPVTDPMPPPTGVLVKGRSDPAVYYIESGVRRAVSFAVFLANRFDFRNVKVGADEEVALLELGDDLRLPEYALVKTSAAPTVYYMVEGVLRPLTLTAFNNRRLLFRDVVTMSPEEFSKYEVGPVVEN